MTADEVVQRLAIEFFKGSLKFKLRQEDIEIFTWASQAKFLDHTIHSTVFKQYPCNSYFCTLFFKRLIQFLESEQEVHDDMYEFLCSVLKSGNENKFYYRHYVLNNDLDNIITIKETNNMVINGTTGLKTWEAALMLSDWALSEQQRFSDKKILELGSGVGFTGITLSKNCDIKSMIMTDCHQDVLRTINDNININFPNAKCEEHQGFTMYREDTKSIGALTLDWNEIDNLLSSDIIPDIIIGADIVYDPSILDPLVNVFKIFHEKNINIDIFIASVIRNEDTFNEFLKVLEASNFKYTKLLLKRNGYVDWDESINRCLLKINK